MFVDGIVFADVGFTLTRWEGGAAVTTHDFPLLPSNPGAGVQMEQQAHGNMLLNAIKLQLPIPRTYSIYPAEVSLGKMLYSYTIFEFNPDLSCSVLFKILGK